MTKLTPAEKELVAAIVNHMPLTEFARTHSRSLAGVRTAAYKLRKKMDVKHTWQIREKFLRGEL